MQQREIELGLYGYVVAHQQQFVYNSVIGIHVISSPPREGLFCALPGVTADPFVVSAVILLSCIYAFVKFC